MGLKYQIIYADPPWNYTQIGKNFGSNITRTKDGFRPVVSAEDHYNTMTNREIISLPIKNIVDLKACLFIWVTSPLLDIGIQVIKAWGFKYKTVAFVWYKNAVMPGAYTMSQCELCLVGTKGSIPTPRGSRNERQLISEPRGRHSEKPEEARIRIERMFPEQSKVELFARKHHPGWHVWGNEVQSDIDLMEVEK